MTLRTFFLGDGPAWLGISVLTLMFGMPLAGWGYAVWIANETTFLWSSWYAAVHPLTDLVAGIVPGIRKTEQELIGLGYPERALLVRHNLAIIWLTACSSWIGLFGLVWLRRGRRHSRESGNPWLNRRPLRHGPRLKAGVTIYVYEKPSHSFRVRL